MLVTIIFADDVAATDDATPMLLLRLLAPARAPPGLSMLEDSVTERQVGAC